MAEPLEKLSSVVVSNGGTTACSAGNYVGNSRANHPRPQTQESAKLSRCAPLAVQLPYVSHPLPDTETPYLLGQALTTAKSAPMRGLQSSLKSHPQMES